MTAQELLDIDPATLAAMSDNELAAYVADLIPLARSAYVGKTQSDSIILPSGRRTSLRAIQKDNETAMAVLRMAGVQIPTR